jgi:CarD family transcriptional regulator, regulator of rRNA transcription
MSNTGAFRKGDRVVHPRHGAAVVEDLVERETFGETRTYLKLCLPHGLTLMVPADNTEDVGLRDVVSKDEVERVFDLLREEERAAGISLIWSQRYKTNLAKLTSGDIYQVSEVVRHLSCREREKALSVADRRMLAKAREILISELTFATDSTAEHTEAMVDDALGESKEPNPS